MAADTPREGPPIPGLWRTNDGRRRVSLHDSRRGCTPLVLPRVTAYLIDPRRGIDASSHVIPQKFAGTLIHDG